ncbi:hypothetical protein LCGC14_2446770, partial [marine sediment metagenome]
MVFLGDGIPPGSFVFFLLGGNTMFDPCNAEQEDSVSSNGQKTGFALVYETRSEVLTGR